MYPIRRVNDSVHWFMNELTSRVVAESGIPTDIHHIGKILLRSLKDDPDLVLQIDGATGEQETSGSVLERSVRCALALKKLGLQRGDVITLMAPNHLDVAIPYYAALYLGLIVAPIDRTLGVSENRFTQFPTPTKMVFIISPLQWLTAIIMFHMAPILRFTRLQTSQPITTQHASQLINTYKPSYKIVSPPFLINLLRSEVQCDFSCFETIIVGGSAVTADLIREVKKVAPNTEVLNGLGMSEVTSLVFISEGLEPESATVGKPIGGLQYRLIDVETQEDIYEPNTNGELWVKGPGIVKGYYRNPDATAETFTEDRWFKTGDLYYRDEHYNFFFVERIKLLLKYMNNQISPVELEALICQHPGVQEVAVTGVPEPQCGELPVACVVRRPGVHVTAEEIKQLVKENLADSKQLRGGVIFLDAIPRTSTTKVNRKKLKEIAMQCPAKAT
ncbi:luciferin 4-monooxygenase-like [Leguminivora glycinivorella]|uniref:luciferin 4-monooxygenase-like n=1 Tax=Leguminivora glycinivorella TaxID=1035111 RepID=UPI00200FB669|nr:luciferin 4-monooxygenase-like [Leguminivora glycinivorella]